MSRFPSSNNATDDWRLIDDVIYSTETTEESITTYRRCTQECLSASNLEACKGIVQQLLIDKERLQARTKDSLRLKERLEMLDFLMVDALKRLDLLDQMQKEQANQPTDGKTSLPWDLKFKLKMFNYCDQKNAIYSVPDAIKVFIKFLINEKIRPFFSRMWHGFKSGAIAGGVLGAIAGGIVGGIAGSPGGASIFATAVIGVLLGAVLGACIGGLVGALVEARRPIEYVPVKPKRPVSGIFPIPEAASTASSPSPST